MERNLPDKAIDLIDEAASQIRMEIDSKPEAMDKLERRLIQYKIEREALKKETDEASKKRLHELAQQIAELAKEYSHLEEIWKAEKAVMQGSQRIKEQLDQLRLEFEMANRVGDFTRMSELRYGRIPELEQQLQAATIKATKQPSLIRNKVTEDEIAEFKMDWYSNK
jgi:ATP-dependent Clp protease ATP-binding subunit ClpB